MNAQVTVVRKPAKHIQLRGRLPTIPLADRPLFDGKRQTLHLKST